MPWLNVFDLGKSTHKSFNHIDDLYTRYAKQYGLDIGLDCTPNVLCINKFNENLVLQAYVGTGEPKALGYALLPFVLMKIWAFKYNRIKP